MTLRSLLCLDYGSGICMAERPVFYVQFGESAVRRAHGINKRSYARLSSNNHTTEIFNPGGNI